MDRPDTPGSPAPVTAPADLLRLSDLDTVQLWHLLDLAAAMKQDPESWADARSKRSVGGIFEKPSTRTRVSTAVAAHRLGMQWIDLDPADAQLARGETLEDTGRVLSEYLDLLIFRTFAQRRVDCLADATTIPVINALSDQHHPCQALADLLTLRERFGDLHDLKLAFLGDASGNICHSLLEAAGLAGLTMVVAAPEKYWPDPDVLATARRLGSQHGGRIEVVTDPEEAVRGAHAVYPEVWVPMGKEGERQARATDLFAYQVDDKMMDLSDPTAVFMHCLPAHREEEVTSAVLDGPRSVAWQQAGNRLYTAQAVMHLLLVGDA